MSFERYSLFPIKYPTLYDLYKKQVDAFWVTSNVTYEEDKKEWREKLSDQDKHFLTFTLAFFAQADGIVLQNLDNNFSIDIAIPEVSLFYGIQAGIEAIHWETYAVIIDSLIDNRAEKEKAFKAIEHYPCIKQKAEWIKKWMCGTDKPFLQRLVAFACTEGIFFSSAFASIYFYKKRGLLPGVSLANSYIARDEGMHRDFGCELFKILRKMQKQEPEEFKRLLKDEPEITNEQINEIVKQAVEIEKAFVQESLNVELIGINSDSMKVYVEFTADHLLKTLDLDKLYNAENPFDWMTMISLSKKQNFFEGRVSEYKKASGDTTFEIEDEF